MPKRDIWYKKNGRKTLQIGGESIIHEPLVPKDKIIFPPLHIKLGLMKQYVKALDKDEHYCFRYLWSTLPGRSKEKLKAEIFVGPKIWKMIRDNDFLASVTRHAFVDLVNILLGDRKADNYTELLNELFTSFEFHDCNNSIKIYFLLIYLDISTKNLGNVEQWEGFYQEIKVMEECYLGPWDEHMMADYCYSLKRDIPDLNHSRNARKRKFPSSWFEFVCL